MMKLPDDPLGFAHHRLRHRESALDRPILRQKPRVTRRIVLELTPGQGERVPSPDSSVSVHCHRGSLWITQDGDPRDVILWPQEAYRPDHDSALYIFALEAALLEIEFDDDADVLH